MFGMTLGIFQIQMRCWRKTERERGGGGWGGGTEVGDIREGRVR